MLKQARRAAAGVLALAASMLVTALPSALASAQPQANLGLELTGTPAVVTVGGEITYTATAGNLGPADAAQVTLRDWLPARSQLVSASPSQGSCSGERPLVCQLGPLARGASATVTLLVRTTQPGMLVDHAGVSAPGTPDRRQWNNARSVYTRVLAAPQANLALALRGEPALVHVGDQVTYTATVRNLGPADASAVALLDRLPGKAALVSATASQGACAGSKPLICELGTLPNGASASVTIVASASRSGEMTNHAWVSSGTPDARRWNNQRVVWTRVLPAPQTDLGLALRRAPAVVQVGEQVTYTASVRNLGGVAASDVALRSLIPARAELVSVNASQGSCAGTRPVVCTLGSLTGGAAATVTIAVRVQQPGMLLAEARVSSGSPDRNHWNNQRVIWTRVTTG